MTDQTRLDRLEEHIDQRFGLLTDRVEALGREVAEMRGELRQMNRLQLLLVGAIVVGVVGILLDRFLG